MPPSVFHLPRKEMRPPRRCEGTTGGTGARGLGVGRTYANTNVFYDIIPIYGALRTRVRAKVATADATLDFIHVGPDFDPEQKSLKATATLNPAGAENAILYTARRGGFGGQDISVTVVNPGAASALSVSVSGPAITVTLAHSGAAVTSTAAEVKAAIEANAAANGLVSLSFAADGGVGDGSGTMAAVSQTYLIMPFTSLVGTQYTSGNPSQLALTAGTEGKTDIDAYGEGYMILKLTGAGSGAVSYVDVSQHCEVP